MTDAAFDVALRGYDRRQVDERIRILRAELAAAEHALRATRERAAALEDEVHRLRSANGDGGASRQADSGQPGPGSDGVEPNGVGSFGARVEKLLLVAEQEACAVREQAGAEAAALIERAKVEAEEHTRRAAQEIAARKAEVQRLAAAAAVEADQLREAATREAEQTRKTARGEAAQLVEQARIEADRLVAVATEASQRQEQASAQELQRLARVRDQVNAELYRAKSVLDSLFPGPAGGAGEIRPAS